MSTGTSQPLRGPPIDAEMETQLLKWEENMKATEILEREHRVIERVAAACGKCAQVLEEGAEAISDRAASYFAVERQSA